MGLGAQLLQGPVNVEFKGILQGTLLSPRQLTTRYGTHTRFPDAGVLPVEWQQNARIQK